MTDTDKTPAFFLETKFKRKAFNKLLKNFAVEKVEKLFDGFQDNFNPVCQEFPTNVTSLEFKGYTECQKSNAKFFLIATNHVTDSDSIP